MTRPAKAAKRQRKKTCPDCFELCKKIDSLESQIRFERSRNEEFGVKFSYEVKARENLRQTIEQEFAAERREIEKVITARNDVILRQSQEITELKLRQYSDLFTAIRTVVQVFDDQKPGAP